MKLLSVALALAALCSSSVHAQRARPVRGRTYVLVDLGALAGSSSSAQAVDESGTVVGWSQTDDGTRRAWLWRDGGEAHELGTLQNGSYSSATAISEDGAFVVGDSGIRPLENPEQFQDIEQGFVWSDEVMQSVGALYNPATPNRRFGTSGAHGVNDHGQVVGFSIVFRQNLQSAFLWQNGVMTDIGLANETAFNSRAFDINDSGQVVGDIVLGSRDAVEPQAFLWEAGAFRYLGPLAGDLTSSAVAINDAGEIAGWSGDSVATTAVLWTDDGSEGLGALPGDASSRALDVNDAGDVVGWSGSPEQSRAFIWCSGRMRDLNAALPRGSDWTLVEAAAINDRGWIAGTAFTNGLKRAFLLKPVERSTR
jgi:probable HAF family extracellular repeat protein